MLGLIPFTGEVYIEDDVLHFDVIAGITADALHRMRGLRDPVAEAWRKSRRRRKLGGAPRAGGQVLSGDGLQPP